MFNRYIALLDWIRENKHIKHLEVCRSYVVEKLEATEEELANALHRIEDLELDLEYEKMRNKS